MLLAWRDANSDGLMLWSVALMVYACGFVVLLDRMLEQPRLPSPISLYIGNVCMTVSAACMLWAVYQFQRRPAPWALGVGIPTFGVIFYAVVLDWPTVRIGLGTLLVASQIVLTVHAVLHPRWRAPGRGVWLVVFGLGVALLAFVLRIGGLLIGYPVSNYQSPSVLQTLTFMASFMSMMLTSIGFLYMVKERADEANRVLAVQDPLTGALNRRALLDAMDRDLSRAVRSRQALALLMVDIDHFKHINDQHGHLAGDRVLKHVVQVLGQRVRSQDLVARFGGEEFVVLAPDTSAVGAVQLAESLRAAMLAQPARWADQVLPITVSVGVVSLTPGNTTSWQELVELADRALYEAKRLGRDRVINADELIDPPSAHPDAQVPQPA
jgi:diguanylate cyclase (GGDEF)-like protein